jgi:hypothetical protein
VGSARAGEARDARADDGHPAFGWRLGDSGNRGQQSSRRAIHRAIHLAVLGWPVFSGPRLGPTCRRPVRTVCAARVGAVVGSSACAFRSGRRADVGITRALGPRASRGFRAGGPVVGSSCRIRGAADPDSTVLEPAGHHCGMGRPRGRPRGWVRRGSARDRLGRSGRRVGAGGRALIAADRRAFVGRARGRLVGHPENRRAGGSAGAVVDRPGGRSSSPAASTGASAAARRSRSSGVERAGGAGMVDARSIRRSRLDRRRPGRGRALCLSACAAPGGAAAVARS